MNTTIKRSMLAVMLAAGTTAAPAVLAADEWEGNARDAWIDGKLEASYLLNTELNNFKIDTMVEDGAVTLSGYVPSVTHKELAAQIAENLDGVTTVNNELQIGDQVVEYSDNDRDFSTRFYDMTTTMRLKSTFAVTEGVDATDINIDTVDGVVTLDGEVESMEEKQLAERIASNYDHVNRVDNRLRIVAAR